MHYALELILLLGELKIDCDVRNIMGQMSLSTSEQATTDQTI